MRGQSTVGLGRREWLLGVGASWLASAVRADGPRDLDPEADVKAIEEQARKVGLAAFSSVESPNYRVIGDAPAVYLKLTLEDCEAVSADFFRYYQAEGFEVERPKARLTAVAFANLRSYAAFLGSKVDSSNGGRYDRASNRLYVFDYRPNGANLNLRAGHLNQVFLAHEATHQLAFNSGLLDRPGDVPRAISEGIALFGEIRKPNGPSPPGRLNSMRLTDLAHKQRQVPWIPLPRLIAEDGPIDGKAGFEAMLLAYAQSWLLVYHLMKEPDLLPKFRDYLKAIRPRRDSKNRLDDARAHLGDLDSLDKDLKRLSIKLLKAN
jgi:Protein of unknown function (DUF1570)